MGVLARDNVPCKRVMRVFHFETKPRAGITSGLSQSGRDAHATFACAQNTRSTRMPPPVTNRLQCAVIARLVTGGREDYAFLVKSRMFFFTRLAGLT